MSWQTIKNWHWALVTGVVVFTGVFGAGMWAAEQKAKIDRIEQATADNAAVIKKQADLEDKMFDFTMSLWKIEPEQVNKWQEVPQHPRVTPSGDTLLFEPWIVFEGLDRLLRYVIEVDSVGAAHLLVDTLYEHVKDST